MRRIGGLLCMWMFAMLTACSTVPQKPATSAQAPAGHGTVLVRVTANSLKKMFSFSLEARPSGSKGAQQGIFFAGWGMQSEGYWTVVEDHLDKGQLVALQIPAGSYEFYRFHAQTATIAGTKSITPNPYFSVPFNVSPGETVYLGEVYFQFNDRSRPYLRTDLGDTFFAISIRDNRAKDLKEATGKIAGLDKSAVVIRLLKQP